MNSTQYAESGNTAETPNQILIRRVKMHEFLMTGGIKAGTDERGNMIYGPPITADAEKFPICPWHDETTTSEADRCDAWTAILNGEGYWTKIESELKEAEAKFEVLAASEHTDEEDLFEASMEIADLKAELEDRPRDARALRERTGEQIAAERRSAGVYAAAGPKGPGNPWDRQGPTRNSNIHYGAGDRVPEGGINGSYVRYGGHSTSEKKDSWWKPKPRLEDARDTTIKAARDLGGEIPDEITIEGDEGDEQEGTGESE